uniref:Uncharacterized protein n=1 Tax=Chromera velia CCMP2878 TaxID=1169474 RepID=A0A0G4HRK9_9ALVE|eukprot:Cvel_30669.t1-p1 / transcript=Cvel_30669.t1 / gene=Cvel_30669 / organism=Chromera_velia_CCMP2878 / gene_product=hypothetical protein / transcript_product=hypothetical protein / location=Cvel_scaffold4415:3149-5176(-) / protein_length=485 / sequence_SO=supercontig / SO=protein_coding / is_pseudo=false
MEVLMETSYAKYHTDLVLFWAHILKIFRLLKASEVAKFVAMGGTLRPRQEMETRFPSLYLSGEEAVQLMTRGQNADPGNAVGQGDGCRTRIYALSYCWLSNDHPDPKGSTINTVMEGLDVHQSVRQGTEEGRNLLLKMREERGGGEDDEETWREKHFHRTSTNSLPEDPTADFSLLFHDFVSLFQSTPPPTSSSRTPEDDALFKEGLELLSCVYGNTASSVYFLRCTQVPSELNKAPYHLRGWTNFESRVASVKRKGETFHLGPFTETLDGHPLLSPVAFQRMLEEKRDEERSESNTEGFVVRFTNGREDRPLVANLYRQFVLDTQVRGQKKIEMFDQFDVNTKDRGEICGEFFAWIGQQPECGVEEVDLRSCCLNSLSLPPVALGLSAIRTLRVLELDGNTFRLSDLAALTGLGQLKKLYLATYNDPLFADSQSRLLHFARTLRSSRELRDLQRALGPECELLFFNSNYEWEALGGSVCRCVLM